MKKLQYTWWKYLLVFVLVLTFWTTLFKKLESVPAENKISIAFFGNELNIDDMKKNIEEVMTELTDQLILKVSVVSHQVTSKYDFKRLLWSQLYLADLIIIEKSYLDQDFAKTYFKTLPNDIYLYVNNENYYYEDDVAYGYEFNKEEHDIYQSFYQGNDDCCLFFSPESPNLASIYKTGKKENDAALKVADYLLRNC